MTHIYTLLHIHELITKYILKLGWFKVFVNVLLILNNYEMNNELLIHLWCVANSISNF